MIWKPRYSVLAILFCAYFLCYLDRMAMASALPFIAREFDLSPTAMGAVLSAFFLGYALMQIPGGMLVDRFGSNRVITASLTCWSVCTALTGTAGSLAALLMLRILFGLSEGPFAPAASKTIAVWFPQREVGRANGIQLAGINIGAVIAPLLVAPMIVHWGWRSVFLSLLAPGLVLAVLIKAFIKDSPPQTTYAVSEAGSRTANAGVVQVMRVPAVFWCSVTLLFANIASWGLMNWLPTYLLQARGFSVAKMGMFASLPFLAGAIGYYLGGHISDQHFRRRRHIPILFGLLGAGAMTYLAAIAPTGEWAVAALTLAFLFSFIAMAGIFTLPLVIVPKATVGVAFGFVNTIGQIAAFLSPLLIGYVLEVTHRNFAVVFYCLVGLFMAAACAAVRIRAPMFSEFAIEVV